MHSKSKLTVTYTYKNLRETFGGPEKGRARWPFMVLDQYRDLLFVARNFAPDEYLPVFSL